MTETTTHEGQTRSYGSLPVERLRKADRYRQNIKRQVQTEAWGAPDGSSFDFADPVGAASDEYSRDNTLADPIRRNRMHKSQRLADSFQVLESWHGVVSEIYHSYFVARIIAKGSDVEEEAEIPLSEISPKDRENIEVGSGFYWTIGYRHSRAGQLSRESLVLFSRRPGRSRELSPISEEWAKKVSAAWLA